MAIKTIYLGTWFQRTSLHLGEICNFLKYKKGVKGLQAKELEKNWQKLRLKEVIFHEEADFDFIEALSGAVRLTITEDGVILINVKLDDSRQFTSMAGKLEQFYSESLGPVLSFLFSLGAPLPKRLAVVEEVYPLFLVAEGLADREIAGLFKQFKDEQLSTVSNQGLTIFSGRKLSILNYQTAADFSTDGEEELIRNLVFFREFELQLSVYLNLHRTIWEEIAEIREKRSIRCRDFPRVREEILDFLKTLSFVKARLAQMNDILAERSASIQRTLKTSLIELGLDRFEHIKADQKYISHLCQMTIEYVNSTLALLQSLFEENTQRELTTLKFITLLGVLTGFFGMNIAFPWEERWPAIFFSSVEVLIFIILMAVGFYFFLKFFIYNRRFTIRRK